MIGLEQKLSTKDLKKAIRIHYFGYKYTYINPILGVGIVLISTYYLVMRSWLLDKNVIILFLLGIFLILRPVIYVQNILKCLKSSKVSPRNKATIQITDDNKIIASVEDNSTTIDLKDLYSYCDKNDFLFLYLAKNQYFLLDKKQMSADHVHHLTKILATLNIKKR